MQEQKPKVPLGPFIAQLIFYIIFILIALSMLIGVGSTGILKHGFLFALPFFLTGFVFLVVGIFEIVKSIKTIVKVKNGTYQPIYKKTYERKINPTFSEPLQEHVNKETSYCKICGGKITEEDKYCPNCGAKIK